MARDAKHSRSGRSVSVEEQDDMDHDISMQNLEEGLKQFSKENRRAKRDVGDWHVHVRLNVGAFLRKSTRNGGDKTMSTYFTYKGPVNGELNTFILPCDNVSHLTLNPDMCRFIDIIFISDAPTATWVIFQRVLPIAQVQVSSARILLNIIFVSNTFLYTYLYISFIAFHNSISG